jgi:hypothetical protein
VNGSKVLRFGSNEPRARSDGTTVFDGLGVVTWVMDGLCGCSSVVLFAASVFAFGVFQEPRR